LRYTNFLIGFVLLFSVLGAPLEAAARKTTSTKKVTTKKTTEASRKSAAAKGKSSKSKRVQAVRSSPRQSAPTPERYMEIQQALIDKGLHSGPATGQWGPEWVTILKEFQQSQNLKPDGKLGALSLIALGLGPRRDPLAQVAGKPEPMP
jgi:peptidoglycan hydrolase-like protein with peptidoglycan-binding domain